MNKMFVLYFVLLHEEKNIYFIFAPLHEQNVYFIFCQYLALLQSGRGTTKKISNIYKFMFKYVERRKFTETTFESASYTYTTFYMPTFKTASVKNASFVVSRLVLDMRT
jgi:hypothetical protein